MAQRLGAAMLRMDLRMDARPNLTYALRADDVEATYAEVTARSHVEAERLGIPHSAAGLYPPVVWELEFVKNC